MAVDFTNPAIVAGVCTIFGGIALKVTEAWLNRSSSRTTEAAEIRNELRLQISSLREDLVRLQTERDAVEREVDEWKDRYYEQVQKMTALLIEAERLKQKVLEYASQLQAFGRVDTTVDADGEIIVQAVDSDDKP